MKDNTIPSRTLYCIFISIHHCVRHFAHGPCTQWVHLLQNPLKCTKEGQAEMSWPPRETIIKLNTMDELKAALKADWGLQNGIGGIRVFKFQVCILFCRLVGVTEAAARLQLPDT